MGLKKTKNMKVILLQIRHFIVGDLLEYEPQICGKIHLFISRYVLICHLKCNAIAR